MAFNTVTFKYKGEDKYPIFTQISAQKMSMLHNCLLKKGIDLAGAFKQAAWKAKVHVTCNKIPITSVSQLYGLMVSRGMNTKKNLDSFICMRNALIQAANSVTKYQVLTLDLAAFMPGKITKDPTVLGWLKGQEDSIEELLFGCDALIKGRQVTPEKDVPEVSYSTGVLEPFRDSIFGETLAAGKKFRVSVRFNTVSIDSGETLIKEMSKAGADFSEKTVDNTNALIAFAIWTGKEKRDLTNFSLIADIRRVMPDIMYTLDMNDDMKKDGFAFHLNSHKDPNETLQWLCSGGLIEIGDKTGEVQETLIGPPQKTPHIKPHPSRHLRFLI